MKALTARAIILAALISFTIAGAIDLSTQQIDQGAWFTNASGYPYCDSANGRTYAYADAGDTTGNGYEFAMAADTSWKLADVARDITFEAVWHYDDHGATLIATNWRIPGRTLGAGQIADLDAFQDSTLPPAAIHPDSAYAFTTATTDSLYADKLTVATALSLPTGAITSAMVLNDNLTVDDLGPNSVGNSEMRNDAIGNAEMADNAIGSAEVINGSLQAADHAAGSVGTEAVEDSSLTYDDISPKGLTDQCFADNTLTSRAIKNGEILNADCSASMALALSKLETSGNLSSDTTKTLAIQPKIGDTIFLDGFRSIPTTHAIFDTFVAFPGWSNLECHTLYFPGAIPGDRFTFTPYPGAEPPRMTVNAIAWAARSTATDSVTICPHNPGVTDYAAGDSILEIRIMERLE